MRVFVQVAISLALTCLSAFSPRLAAQPVNLHEQERVSSTLLPETYLRGLGTACLRGDDLLARATRRGMDAEGDTWIDALVHLKKQADGEWQFVREVAAVEYSVFADVFSVEDLDCEGPLAAYSHPMGASYVVELTSAGWQATKLAGLDFGSHADVYRGTAAFAGSWLSPTTVALVRKNAAGQWADITLRPGIDANTR